MPQSLEVKAWKSCPKAHRRSESRTMPNHSSLLQR